MGDYWPDISPRVRISEMNIHVVTADSSSPVALQHQYNPGSFLRDKDNRKGGNLLSPTVSVYDSTTL